uniref:DEDD exonuclease domain-containing protein n=1 Tax=Kribbia dieselivorans TaxID=331526 RepID=UPI000838C9C8
MQAVQTTLDDLGTPLSEVTFVVVDLETTGGNPRDCGITEIGAVKVRAGEVLGEFQTFVNPGEPIPAFIQTLTGITNAMVAGAPRLATALPAFLDFTGDAVLVAHNAGFDVGFLKAGASALDLRWPGYKVLDTVTLARQLVSRDDAPNHKLSSLAALFGATVTPNHRALQDARATVDVLHGLIERVGNQGVHTFEELQSYSGRVSPATRRKRHLADDLPNSPGVYMFKDERGDILYVGTSVDVRTRVRSYFTASEKRRRMTEMVRLATSVQAIACATTLEAEVRELRLIAEHKPRYNRRSRNPGAALWVRLTDEPFPRLSMVKSVRAGDIFMGPFSSRQRAEEAMAAVHEAVGIRQCLTRLSPTKPTSPCVLAEMGRCSAPCTGAVSVEGYSALVGEAAGAMSGDARPVVAQLHAKMATLSSGERFEEAGTVRDRMISLVRGASRAQRIAPLAATPELV